MSHRPARLAPAAAAAATTRGAVLLTLILMSTLMPPGCSSDQPEAPKLENITRSWHATSCVYRHETNGALRVDLVADGWTVDLFINDNGAFRYTWTPPGGGEQYFDGTWALDGQTVSLTRNGYGFAWQFTAEVREESLTLRGAHAEYDFDDDGTPEPAIWDMDLGT